MATKKAPVLQMRLDVTDMDFLRAIHASGGVGVSPSEIIALIANPWRSRRVEAIRHLITMRDRGLILNAQSEKAGPSLWAITDAAMALIEQWLPPAPAVQPTLAPVNEPEPVQPKPSEPSESPEPDPAPAIPPRAKRDRRGERAARIAADLARVRARLKEERPRPPSIPRQAAQAYLSLNEALPSRLRQVLAPITALVEGRSL